MSAEDLEKYETEMELSLYREYKDIVGQFSYVVETERRFYLVAHHLISKNALCAVGTVGGCEDFLLQSLCSANTIKI